MIVPGPPIVATVEAVVELANVIEGLLEAQDENFNPGFANAVMATCDISFRNGEPDGLVEPSPAGLTTKFTWSCFV